MNKTALKKYNKRNSLVIVSPFPKTEKNNVRNSFGVGIYTYHLIPHLKKLLQINNRKIIILADVLDGKKTMYEENGVLIYRCWNRGSINVFKDTLNALMKFSKVKTLFIQFEFNMYGDALATGTFPIFQFYLKLKRYNYTLLLHQVVDDLSTLSGHVNIRRNSLKMAVFSRLLRFYFYLVTILSRKVIVHDDVLKKRLEKVKSTSVFVIPHGLGEYTAAFERVDARKRLGLKDNDFIVLSFGFIAWYKGSDWILEKFEKYYKKTGDEKVKLVLGGGKSANLKNKKHYLQYYSEIEDRALELPNVILTGFIPEKDVHLYFCAADIVVLPYRTQMSASGPFATGLNFDRPFLISENLEEVLETSDIKTQLLEYGIKKEQLMFKMSGNSFFEKVSRLLNSRPTLNRLSKLSTSIKKERLWSKAVEKFIFVIDA